MKRLLFLFVGILMAADIFAQDYIPTANWPYLYPEFMEGELVRARNKRNKAQFNIHLDLGALHYVENGIIKESATLDVVSLIIGEDVFRNVGGKMLKVMAESESGYVVQETRANYSAVVRDDGAYGTTALNSTTTKTYLHNQNVVNSYNGYLLTDVYADLLAMKDDAEILPVRQDLYLVMRQELIPADKKSVADLEGVDKKAFKAFLKAERIKWDEPEDLVKVMDYIVAQ